MVTATTGSGLQPWLFSTRHNAFTITGTMRLYLTFSTRTRSGRNCLWMRFATRALRGSRDQSDSTTTSGKRTFFLSNFKMVGVKSRSVSSTPSRTIWTWNGGIPSGGKKAVVHLWIEPYPSRNTLTSSWESIWRLQSVRRLGLRLLPYFCSSTSNIATKDTSKCHPPI
uniref:Uncharacterized protein n=1 Tax=Cacopsylla melanoneura TaxID=428564 RepID=A0A8D8VC44_9HEMI